MCYLFLWVSWADLHDGSVDEVRDVTDLGALADGYEFVVFTWNQEVFDGDVDFFSKLNAGVSTWRSSYP